MNRLTSMALKLGLVVALTVALIAYTMTTGGS